MGKKQPAPVTTPPQPIGNSTASINGSNLGTYGYDKATGNTNLNYTSSPFDQQTQNYYESMFPGLLESAFGNSAGSTTRNAQLQSYQDALYGSSKKALDEGYRQNRVQARDTFNKRGMLNSTGYADYMNQGLNREYNSALADAGTNAYLGREQLAANDRAEAMNTLSNAQSLRGYNDALTQTQMQLLGDLYGSGLQSGALNYNQIAANNNLQNTFNMNKYNQQRALTNSLIGGAFGLAGAGLSAFGGGFGG